MKTANERVKKNLFYALPVICLIFVVVIGLQIVQPKIIEAQNIQQKKQTEITQKNNLEKKLAQLKELEVKKSELLAQLTAMTVALPDQKEIPQIFIQLQKIALESDLTIQSIQASPGKLIEEDTALANKIGPQIDITMSFRGTNEAMKTFLAKVYKAKRLLNMDSIQINGSSDQNNDNTVTVNMSLIVYYQPRPKIPKDPTEALPVIDKADQEIFDLLQGYETYTTEDVIIPQPSPETNQTDEASPSANTQGDEEQ